MISIIANVENEICKDITEDKKQEILNQFDVSFKKYNFEIFLSKVNPLKPNPLETNPITIDIDLYRDTLKCKSLILKNGTYINEIALCPWEYRIKIRANQTVGYKYPMYRKEAHCICSTCDARIKNVYSCMPVLESMPCLVRDKCGSDGYYQWVPNIERVSVACVCASYTTNKF